MSKIKNEDLGDNEGKSKKLTAEELEQVKGGPAFLKLGDIDGESLNVSVDKLDADKLAVAPTLIKKRTSR